MKILVVSDIHYETGKRRYHLQGFDEAKSLPWLRQTAEARGVDTIINLGDLGDSVTRQEWDELVRDYRVYSLYGNHDNYHLLKRVKNVDGSPLLMNDSDIRDFYGQRFGFINGIVTHTGKQKRRVPRKTPEQFVKVAEGLRDKVDFLCMHESPPVALYRKKLLGAENVLAAKLAADIAAPKITLSGHLGFGPFTIAPIIESRDILSIRIDSGQDNKGYAVIDTRQKDITLYQDTMPKYKFSIPAVRERMADVIENVNKFNAERNRVFSSLARDSAVDRTATREGLVKLV